MHTGREDKGAVLILAMVFISVLAAFAASVLYEGYTKSRAVALSEQTAQNHLLAEAALEDARDDLNDINTRNGTGEIGTAGWSDWNANGHADWDEVKDLGGRPVPMIATDPTSGLQRTVGHYWAQVTTLADPQYKRITGYGRMASGPGGWRDANGDVQLVVKRVEIVVKGTIAAVQPHPAFSGKYAIYAGGGGPDYRLRFGGQTGGGWRGGNHADLIDGDIYCDGNVQGTGNSQATGRVEVPVGPDPNDPYKITGTMQKSAGGCYEGVDPIPPPDLAGMDYRNISDVNVTKALDGNDTIQITNYRGLESGDIVSEGITTVPANNPAHIFCKESFKDSAYSGGNYKTDGTNYHLGDWVSSTDGEDIVVDDKGNDKIYYIDGNLWLDTLNFGPTLRYGGTEADEGVRITVVVEGNIYIGDHLAYGSNLDGIALIAIQKRDANGAPDNTRTEGSGNVFFGDLSASRGGLDVNALLFAENTFADVVKGAGDVPLEFAINGLMAASGRVNLQDRGVGLQHSRMVIKHDQRLKDGTLSLPGLPFVTVQQANPPPPGPPWVEQARWQVR